ncbi:MAG: hypothetical protein NVS1B11_11920 [Terriglobales bacterium]
MFFYILVIRAQKMPVQITIASKRDRSTPREVANTIEETPVFFLHIAVGLDVIAIVSKEWCPRSDGEKRDYRMTTSGAPSI